MRKFYLFILLLPLLLTACSTSQRLTSSITAQESSILDVVMEQYAHNIEDTWGPNEIIIPNPKEFLEYSADFKTRSFINFTKNRITFETVDSDYHSVSLKEAIVSLLLMPDYHSNDDKQQSVPFLLGQVLNEYHQVIKTAKQADDFAEYLLKHDLKYRYSSTHQKIYFITVSLIYDHVDERAKKYLPYVRQASKKYDINSSLILAIIETESQFNPYAVSSSAAIGLMQIQPYTAGKDVFLSLGLKGEPSRSYLLDPRNNIDIGTHYLALVKNNYLKGIKDPQSMRFALITAYNAGAGSVLRTFSKNRKHAIDIINSMTPAQVYHKLNTQHPSAEARRYLFKVVRAQNQILHPKTNLSSNKN